MLSFENRYVKNLIDMANRYVIQDECTDYVQRFPSVVSFTAIAEAMGYKHLGYGYFSQAWTHPEIKGYVIKLGFKKDDSGAAYAAFCRDNQDLVGIPKIYGIERFSSGYCVLLDEYTEVEVGSREYYKINELCSILHGGDPECELGKTALRIRNFFKGAASFDLHYQNAMLDKGGNLIITDPVSYSFKKKDHSRRAIGFTSMFNLDINALEQINKNFKSFRGRGGRVNLHMDEVEFNKSFNKPSITTFHLKRAKAPRFIIDRNERNGIKPRRKL